LNSRFLKGFSPVKASLKKSLEGDLVRVDDRIRESLSSDVNYINNLMEMVLSARGKRLRPALLILAGGRPGASGDDLILAGAVVEIIHLATLLHDDVVDGSHQRRGRPTLNAEHGDGPAVLLADFVYSRAITLLVDAELTRVLSLLASSVHRMSIGELMQLELRDSKAISEDLYFQVISEKTANLIEATCRSGGILAGRPPVEIDALGEFGRNLGLAFQIVDDVLDYVADAAVLGKPVGSDLLDGKRTLPLLKVLGGDDETLKNHLEELLLAGGENREEIVSLVRDNGGVQAAMDEARRFGVLAGAALEVLPADSIREAMQATVDYVIDRDF
jgi:octaprenyl-diphosphate synthase